MSGWVARRGGNFCPASCTRFSPKMVWPAAMASEMALAGWVLETATRVMCSGVRPTAVAAMAIRARMLARAEAIDTEWGMDERLLAWGRAVKQRRRSRHPVLWLFTDALRLPDPLPAIAGLPRGLCGVVFRHDGVEGRSALTAKVAALCKRRRIPLVVAGDARLAAAIGAGVHLRGGRWPGVIRPAAGVVTSSAHSFVELRRARRAGADIVFLSPVFRTESHADKPVFGPVRWVNFARHGCGTKVYALGGVSGENVYSIARLCRGVGAISALIP